MSESDSPRRILHERSPSHNNAFAKIRLVPSSPPRLLGREELDEIHSRTPLPTHPSYFLSPSKRNSTAQGQGQGSPAPALGEQFQRTTNAPPLTSPSGSSVSTTHESSQSVDSGTDSPASSRPKPPPKKRLHVHKDNKTFSLLQDDSQSANDDTKSPTSILSASQKSTDSFHLSPVNARDPSNSTHSCAPEASSVGHPSTPASQSKQQHASADHIVTNSPWNYQLVGGLRKVPKTPDLKQKASSSSDIPPASLPDSLDGSPALPHDLSTKPSFQSTQSDTTTSENANYKIYSDNSPATSEVALALPSSSGSNHRVYGEASPPSSVIYHPQSSPSGNENYKLHGGAPLTDSYIDLAGTSEYSQESLVVPPLNTQSRNRRSNETLGYYKSRSRESLRTGSLTSISTVLSQQEAVRAFVGTGSIIQLPTPILEHASLGSSSWAEPQNLHFPRSHMNEHPHQWSSQLSTVLSVSDGGTDRNSRSWSSDNGRRSSGFPSTPSRHSRQMLSISSSIALEEDQTSGSRSESVEPPAPVFMRNAQRHKSSSSFRMVEDQDEYGDGITDMQDLRTRPSRTRLSGFYSAASSDNGRTNTMRSAASSRANSLLAHTIPTWAKLYYGSGERRHIGAPGSSTEGTDSRASSFRSGSPNTDHFPLSIYSPRRRPREMGNQSRLRRQGSLDITPATRTDDEICFNNNDYSRRFRTWSMSSIWSPHLRLDRRAKHRSMWEPPSVNWTMDGGWFGRRNVQIVMFILGFIFPLAWMIAACLPLPPPPILDTREQDNSTSNLESSNSMPNDYIGHFGRVDEARYESTKWWRRLNQYMSLVGLLVIVVIVILVVIGIREGW